MKKSWTIVDIFSSWKWSRVKKRWWKSIVGCYAQFFGIHQQSHTKWQWFFMIKTLLNIRSFWKDVKKIFEKQKLLVKIEKYGILLWTTKKKNAGVKERERKERGNGWTIMKMQLHDDKVQKQNRYQANVISKKWLTFDISHPKHWHPKKSFSLYWRMNCPKYTKHQLSKMNDLTFLI